MSINAAEILLSLIQGEAGLKWSKDHYGWGKIEDSDNVCNWDGVNCDPSDGVTVTRLIVGSSEFIGTIPRQLSKLTTLKEFSFPQNKVYGTIPREFASLPHLEKVNLSNNRLTGTLPLFSSPSLVIFDISHNLLRGTLPSNIGMMHDRMEDFDVTDNRLEGPIPDSFRHMTALQALSLSTNNFSGTIPQSIGYCRVLGYLFLDNNYLMGTIPPTLAKLGPSVKEIWLHENLLSGTVPAAIADLRNMFNFYIDGNKFTGTVPHELCRKELNADFFGETEESKRNYCESVACPMGFVAEDGIYPCHKCPNRYLNPYLGGRLGHCMDINQRDILQILYTETYGMNWVNIDLEWNPENDYYCAFSGITCDNKNNVIGINLKNKGLKGKIPEALGFLRFLEHLDLSDNQLTGFLPSDLRWAPLETLVISGNLLQGIVPPKLCEQTGINGNGENGSFDCQLIACPSGYYSPTGRSGTNRKCLPCNGDVSYLGSKNCLKVKKIPGISWGNSNNVFSNNTPSKVFGLSSALATICLGFAVLVYAYRKYKNKIRKEEITHLYQDVLDESINEIS